ncbi:MAG TPA: flagellar motor switch protein FliG [Bryobacteraceae bacterium]|nr:flagellar motor switch protein FliG [Bryobacteraceae bacterium]
MEERTSNSKMRGTRKAAVLLMLLGDQISGEILKQLDEDEIERIGREIARLTSIPAEDGESVLEEFYEMSVAQAFVVKGGVEYARKMLQNALGPDQARRMLDRVIKTLGSDRASFDVLQKADPQQLAKFIHSEHPQTIALILSHLNSSHAASLLFSLPSDMRADVALRMANLDQISPEITSKIAAIVGHKLKALGEFSREAYGGVRAVAEMFNRLDSNTSKEILDAIDETDAGLGTTIRHLMFVFDDLLLLSAEAVKEVLAKVDRKILTVALKGTSDQLKGHFLQAMSQRGAEMLREDMEALGPVKISEVETAQQQIIAVVRQLESEGVISLKGAGGEQYVV